MCLTWGNVYVSRKKHHNHRCTRIRNTALYFMLYLITTPFLVYACIVTVRTPNKNDNVNKFNHLLPEYGTYIFYVNILSLRDRCNHSTSVKQWKESNPFCTSMHVQDGDSTPFLKRIQYVIYPNYNKNKSVPCTMCMVWSVFLLNNN